MRVDDNMIDEELRVVGRRMRMMTSFTSVTLFRLMDLVLKWTNRNTKIDGLASKVVWLPRGPNEPDLRLSVHGPLEQDGPLPMFLYIHGGGYAMGNPEMFNDVIRKFIQSRECVVVSPAYRKSLQEPYPAALDDCYQALLWMRDNAEELGGRADQLIVGGHSAGGGLTAAVSLRARARQEVKIGLQLPIYPMLDDRNMTESVIDNDAPAWNEKMNKLGWHLYLKGAGDDIPAEAAPARATDYSGLPDTITFVGDVDPFRDETIEYVENLKRAGVKVDFMSFKGGFHGFEQVVPEAKLSLAADAFLYPTFTKAVNDLVNSNPQ